VINSKISPILHRLATIHQYQMMTTDRRTDDNCTISSKLDCYLSTAGYKL